MDIHKYLVLPASPEPSLQGSVARRLQSQLKNNVVITSAKENK